MFRFTIRELVLVTLLVGVALGWWLDRNRLAVRAAEGDRWIYKYEGLASAVSNGLGWRPEWDPTGRNVSLHRLPQPQREKARTGDKSQMPRSWQKRMSNIAGRGTTVAE